MYQCVHPAATLQDGISHGSASPAPQGRLGSHVGSAGCLPACFHPSFLQTPSLFHFQGSGVSVSSTPVRSERLTMGFYQTSCGTSNSNLSLPGRLVVGRELQVPPAAAPSEDSRAHSTVGLPIEFGEVFPDSLSNSVLSGSFFRHSEVFPDSLSNSVLSGSFFRHSEASSTPPTPQSSGVAISGAGDHSSLVLSRQDLAGVPWSPSQFHVFDSSVQVIHAPSSTSLPEVLFSAQGHSFPTCSPFPSSQESLSSMGFSGVPSAGKVLLPSSSSVDFLRRVQPRLGSFSSSLPCVRRLVSSGVSPSHQLARASSSLSGPSELRRSDLRSIDSDSIRQLHSLLHQPSGRDSLPFPLQSHVGSVGLVSGERYSPLSLSCPRGRQPAGGLPLQGEVPAFRVDTESLSFSEDLSSLPSPGDILVRFGPDLPASQVLLQGSGPTSLGYRCDVVPVVGSTSLRVPSVQSAPSNTSESSSGQSRPPSHALHWPQRPWFLGLLSLLVDFPRSLPPLPDLVHQPISLFPHPHPDRLHLSL